MSEKVRWGIVGTGGIARKFALGLCELPDAQLAAVGSRSRATADAFAREFNVARAHASYEALMNDPAVDAVYIATPHSLHAENMLAAIAAGKPVLCEKPFTINARETATVIDAAREKRILVMEAMWTRFLPAMVRLRKLLAGGLIGEIGMVTAYFGFKAAAQSGRLFDPKLGGGALLDVGVYPVSLASMILGPQEKIIASGKIGASGVDEMTTVILFHRNRPSTLLCTSIVTDLFEEAIIIGSLGRIKISAPWWRSSALSLERKGCAPEKFDEPFSGNGYQFEATAFQQCLRENKSECDVMPLAETLAIMKTLDTVRAQIGLKYPMD